MKHTHATDPAYDPVNMLSIIEAAKSILYFGRSHWVTNPDGSEEYVERCSGRDWHRNLQARNKMHPVVIKAIELARPDNWQQLLLEWPHVSEADSQRLAYTRDERAGRGDKQTVTSVAKYLRSRFSTLPDHAVRDLAALVSTQGCFMVDDLEKMVYHKQRGPYSCMQWENVEPEDHPYNVYDPGHGWKMAVRQEGGETIGNCLVMDRDGRKYFVRSYLKDVGRYSHSDLVLEAWLTDQGFKKRSEWQGERMTFISYRGSDGGFFAPYIDGDCKTVEVRHRDGSDYLLITDNGEYTCDNTDGTAEYTNNVECNDCGARMSEDEGYTVGYHGDTTVCSCCHDGYRTVIGRAGDEYDVPDDDAVYVASRDQWYHSDYLDRNDIVCLENGEYEDEGNAVCIDGEWYHVDDERIILAEDTGEYAMIDDCWTCAESNNWYTNDCTDYVEHDGMRYHADHAPEIDPETN